MKRISTIVQKTTQKSSGHIYRISCHQRVPSLHLLNLSDPTWQAKTESFDKAEILQPHFSSMFTIEPEKTLPEYQTNKIVQNIIITVEIVRKEMIKLNNNKSPGPDEVSPRIPKELITYVCGSLTLLMNESMKGDFAKLLETYETYVMPTLKKR